ncbi:metallophosphoesterase [Streptomyces spiramenti]|uniref:Serine/threonine protein phosphatase n=1 Tax=Streptomyces spiramenti TaxID=2720606 RepID=A0ABX1AS02_9ACTN|nr:metallophosphoesterase [Streptomyces spiramenti]NJP68203.1 serine/threonine protein phosphatase [Streptomyces spiramenti]
MAQEPAGDSGVEFRADAVGAAVPGHAAATPVTAPPPPGTPPVAAPLPPPAAPVADEETAGSPVPAPPADGPGPLYVVGDVHGYLDELRAALRAAGLTDEEDRWAAGSSRLWFLGDFTDRGPDGVGVIDLVMRLSAEAAAAGGYCKALLGNHELLLLGAHRFADTPVESGAGTATFRAAWMLNGGQPSDMERLEDHHVQWMSRLDSLAVEDGHLLLHSDTTAYLDYGDTVEDVNDSVFQALQRLDSAETWELFRKFTRRFAFRDEDGPEAARTLLSTFGGARIVHGHSPIPYLTGEGDTEIDEDGEERPLRPSEPHVYADELAIAMDGGVTMGGPMLVSRLPLTADAPGTAVPAPTA